MEASGNELRPAGRLVLWVIWAAILMGVFVVQIALGHGLPSGHNAPGEPLPAIVYVALGLVLGSSAIRWGLLTRPMPIGRQLALMIVGLMLAEGATFLSIFLIPPTQPETKLLLLALGVVSILQLAPIYARDRPLPR